MEWLNPAGGWAWLGIPVVIALYLLRRKAARHEVPSLLLWQRLEGAREAHKPFQKLRRQWLLILQLVLVTLLAIALMRPAGLGGPNGERVMVFDISASMQAESQGRSRLAEATADALKWVDGIQEGDRLTIISAGQTVQQVLSRSADKSKMRAALESLAAENGEADMEGALSLALAMKRDLPDISIVVYSDTYRSEDDKLQIHTVGQRENNRWVLSLQVSEQQDGLTAFARIANYGEACDVTVEGYADGLLFDIVTLTVEADAQQSVQMTVPGEPQVVWLEIKTEDALMRDNVCYWVRQETAERKALLITQGNIFLEKALALREDLAVYKASAADAVDMTGYDLYVLDGAVPETLPDTGSILAWKPSRSVFSIDAGAEKQDAGRLRAAAGSQGSLITQNLMLSDISLRAYCPLSGGQSILTWGEDSLLNISEENGRRVAAIGFDLHDSNLSMKADFPILMQNLMDFLLPDPVTLVGAAVCGQPISLASDERTVSADIITPSGKTIPAEGSVFTETGEVGVYTLREVRVDGQERRTAFALHIPLAESELRQVPQQQEIDAEQETQKSGSGQEWTQIFLLAFLAILLVEWEVSRRGA